MSLLPLMMAAMQLAPSSPSPSFFQYWGKARPTDQGPDLHLLPYHCMDVAAVGRVYLEPVPEWWRPRSTMRAIFGRPVRSHPSSFMTRNTKHG
jgi:hypothetical protein